MFVFDIISDGLIIFMLFLILNNMLKNYICIGINVVNIR